MTLRTKIYGGYVVALFFCILSIIYLLYHTHHRDRLLNSLSKIDFGKDRYINKVGESLNIIEKTALLINFIPERKVVLQQAELISRETSAINGYLDSLEGLVYINQFELNPSTMDVPTQLLLSTASAIGLIDQNEIVTIPYEIENHLIEKTRKLTVLLSSNIEFEKQFAVQKDRIRTGKILNETINPLIDSLRSTLDLLKQTTQHHALEKTEILSRLSIINIVLTYVVLSFLFIQIVVAILDVRYILKSINQLTAATHHVGLGTFDQKLELRSFTELNNLGTAFNRMTQHLEEIEKLKSDFFNKLVHDFKSPLDNIKQSSAILAKDMADAPLTSQQKKFIDIIQRSASDLRNMVQFQLEESKLIAGQSTLSYQLTDLKELIKERIQLQRPTATAKNINFSVKFTDSDFQVQCDPFKIQRVMDNLLSNAIKFSPRDSTVSIELEAPEEKIQVRIKNSGAGIPLELQPHIFQKYAKQVTPDTGSGTGLGLYTAKYIIELHGGKIWFKSKPGFGTTFYFLLPKQKSLNPAQAIDSP